MAQDDIERIEAVFGAISRIASGEEPDAELHDARCPKCGGSSFARVSDLYSESVTRLQTNPEEANVVRIAGLSYLAIVAKLGPPRQKSAAMRVLVVGIPLVAIAVFVYKRFGDAIGELAIAAAIVLTIVVGLTTFRRMADENYHRRKRWNSLFMCRQCGQLVAS